MDRLLQTIEPTQRQSEIVQRFVRVRVDLGGAAQLALGIFRPAQLKKNDAQHVGGSEMRRRRRQDRTIQLGRPRQFPGVVRAQGPVEGQFRIRSPAHASAPECRAATTPPAVQG